MTAGANQGLNSARIARPARVVGVVLALVCGLALAACAIGGSTPPGATAAVGADQSAIPHQADPLGKRASVKVALLLPLSAKGQAGKVARGLKQAGELALFEFDRPNVLLFTKDTKGTPEGARAAAQEALSSGAELVLGPLYAESVSAASSVTRPAGVPMIAFSSNRAVAGNGVYLLSFLAGEDVPRIIAFATAQGKRNFAALIPKSPYGQIVERSFRSAVSQHGGTVATIQYYPLDANGMIEPVRSIKSAAVRSAQAGRPIDALLIPAGQDALPTLAPILPYNQIDTKRIKLLGTGDWDYANVGREEVLVGGWFPAPDPQGWREFTRRYAKTYGGVPPRISSIAYDAVSLAVSLSNGPAGQRFTAANLTRQSGFAGVDGLFRLQQDGTAERGLAVLEVQRFGPRQVDRAPSAFGSPQYSGLPSATVN